jgi:purine-binding chemotaxis protein CheW
MTELMGYEFDQIEDTQKDRYLTFSLVKECYGIEIQYVTEIVGIQTITNVPELMDYVKGVINLRGKIVPVMDMRLRFHKEEITYSERTCIIIIDIQDITIGLIVDGVSEVITILEQDIEDKPHMNKTINNQYINKIGKVGNEVKLLLDCNMLLNSEELPDISEIL